MQSIKVVLIFTILCLHTVMLYSSPSETAKALHLIPGKKAIIQWERVFKSERKMKKYGINKLSTKEKEALKKYLLDHAADSDHPTVAGDM
jgi:hypothetical protein